MIRSFREGRRLGSGGPYRRKGVVCFLSCMLPTELEAQGLLCYVPLVNYGHIDPIYGVIHRVWPEIAISFIDGVVCVPVVIFPSRTTA